MDAVDLLIMKIIKKEFLCNTGNFSSSEGWITIQKDIENAIKKVTWPNKTKKFTIHPELHGNGVKPIKYLFCNELKKKDWELEVPLPIISRIRPGPLDAVIKLKDDSLFAVEWETGNISSSHRALNKMALGVMKGILKGGILVLPTRNLYQYLTDRIGNYEEILPYFDLWKSIPIQNGILGIYAIEHDSESTSVEKIPKGTDGRAKK
jgi:hypothetical protein